MKSKFITDTQGGFDLTDFGDTEVNYVNFGASSVPAAYGSEAPVVNFGTPVLTSEAVEASSAQIGAATSVALTSGGITINLLFDAAAMAAPASFRAGIEQAASILSATISDQITVNLKIDYSGTGGGAAAGPDSVRFKAIQPSNPS